MTRNRRGDRFHQATEKGYGAQGTMLLRYQVIDSPPKKVSITVYHPVKKGNDPKREKLKDAANLHIRKKFLEFVDYFKRLDGLVQVSHDLGDE